MDRPLDLLRDNLANIATIVEVYEQELDEFKEHLRLKGKNLVQANQEQPAWLVYYDVKRSELKIVVDFMESQVMKVKGKLWKDYTENYSRDLQTKDKEQYINNEPSYLTMLQLYLEAKELYDKYVAVVDSFKARGYALNNITRLVSSDSSEYMIE